MGYKGRTLCLSAIVAALFGVLWGYWRRRNPRRLEPTAVQTHLALLYPKLHVVDDINFELEYRPLLLVAKFLTIISSIAVHGLGTSSPKTWIKYEETPSNETLNGLGRPVNWLSDTRMLPTRFPKAKIWSFDYDSSWYSQGPAKRLLPLAETMLHVIGTALIDVSFVIMNRITTP